MNELTDAEKESRDRWVNYFGKCLKQENFTSDDLLKWLVQWFDDCNEIVFRYGHNTVHFHLKKG